MSSFMCSSNTFSAVAQYVMETRSSLEPSWYTRAGQDQTRKLWAELRDLNHSALVVRYGETDAFEVPDVPAQIPSWPSPSRAAMCKVLDCYLYQCSEGDLPETSLLFQEVKQARNELRGKIVRSLPEYKSGPWDIPDSLPMARRIL